jgi:hypothetical protein
MPVMSVERKRIAAMASDPLAVPANNVVMNVSTHLIDLGLVFLRS